MSSGIYIISNTISDKVYVGQSINFRKRKVDHLRGLRACKHKNPHLQSSFLKYGEEAFSWEFLECPEEHLTEMEQWFIDQYLHQYGVERLYNICLDSCATRAGVPLSEEHCRFISEMHKGNSYTLGRPRPCIAGDNNVARRPEVRKKIAEQLRVLTDGQCVEVYNKHLAGKTQMELAAEYGVGRESVRTAIKHTVRYKIEVREKEKK